MSADNPSGGEPRIALVLLKEGLHGLLQIATKAAEMLLRALTSALHMGWAHRSALLGPLLQAPKLLARLIAQLLSTKAGKALMAACTSILCVQLQYRPGGARQQEGAGGRRTRSSSESDAPPALNTSLVADMSILFGAFK